MNYIGRKLLIPVTVAAVRLLAGSTAGTQPKVLLDGPKARVVTVSIPANAAYKIEVGAPKGTVWVVVNGSGLLLSGDKDSRVRGLSPGDAAKLEPGHGIEFHNKGNASAGIIVVDARETVDIPQHVDLTAGNALEEHSPDNGALLVAVTDLELQEVMELGEPDNPTPGKPRLIKMNEGDVQLLKPGMRTLTNLLGSTVRFVWIGW